MRKPRDITGQQFGRLTVVRPVTIKWKNPVRGWLCQCSCGRTTRGLTATVVRTLTGPELRQDEPAA
jgi:hypothetical protein